MRKVLLLIMVAFVTMGLFACGEKEFAVDGEFMAYSLEVRTNNTPQVVFVTVTIEKGKIAAYSIDTLQAARINNGTTEEPAYVWQWNAQTKKQLGAAYGMKNVSVIQKEWDEQAAAIEAFWLANGVDAVTVNAEGYVDNVAGVSMRDAYSAVALLALENARAGKFVNFYVSRTNQTNTGMDFYSAEMVVTPKGQIESLTIDVLQSTRSATAGTFVWRAASKQELGYAYRMHGQRDLSEADYITWLETNNKLEWFEQIDLIVEDILANGWRTTASTEVPAGVSITTGGYYSLLQGLFGYAGNSVK
jgi:hypothetical protein